jgi:hypothetical protein
MLGRALNGARRRPALTMFDSCTFSFFLNGHSYDVPYRADGSPMVRVSPKSRLQNRNSCCGEAGAIWRATGLNLRR